MTTTDRRALEDAVEDVLSANHTADADSVVRAVLAARRLGLDPWEMEPLLTPAAFLAACECCFEGWDAGCPIHGNAT